MRPYSTKYVKLSQEEWSRVYGRLWAKRHKFQLFLGALGVTLAFVGALAGWHDFAGRLLVTLGIGLICMAIGDRIYLDRFLRNYLSDPENAALLSEGRAHVTDDGIAMENINGMTGNYPWEMISRVDDLGDIRLLYLGRMAPLVMIKRSHEPKEWDDLAEWIAAKVPESA